MWGGKRGDRMKEALIGMRDFNKCDRRTLANRLIDQPTNGPMDRHGLLKMWEDAHEKNFVLLYLLTTVLPHSHLCSNAHRLNMTPKHYQSTLNY